MPSAGIPGSRPLPSPPMSTSRPPASLLATITAPAPAAWTFSTCSSRDRRNKSSNIYYHRPMLSSRPPASLLATITAPAPAAAWAFSTCGRASSNGGERPQLSTATALFAARQLHGPPLAGWRTSKAPLSSSPSVRRSSRLGRPAQQSPLESWPSWLPAHCCRCRCRRPLGSPPRRRWRHRRLRRRRRRRRRVPRVASIALPSSHPAALPAPECLSSHTKFLSR